MFLLVPAHPGSPGQGPLNGCVRVCVHLPLTKWAGNRHWSNLESRGIIQYDMSVNTECIIVSY